jgi:hypothetical protein
LLLCRLLHPLVLLRVHLALRPRPRQDVDIVNRYLDRLRLELRPRDRDRQRANVASNDLDGEAEALEQRLFQP